MKQGVMEFTHQELEEMHGTCYYYNDWREKIIQEFASNVSHTESFKSSYEIVELLYSKAGESYRKKMEGISECFLEYSKLPPFRKFILVVSGAWRKAKKHLNALEEKCGEDFRKEVWRIDFIETDMLDTEAVYTLESPLLEKGQDIYISVTQKNGLDVGVYKVTLDEVEWWIDIENKNIRLSANVQVGDESYRIEARPNDPHEYSTGMAYHKVHTNPEDAINRVRNHLETQMIILQSTIDSLELHEEVDGELDRAVGSMGIDGVHVSDQTKESMKKIILEEMSLNDVVEQLVTKYQQDESTRETGDE